VQTVLTDTHRDEVPAMTPFAFARDALRACIVHFVPADGTTGAAPDALLTGLPFALTDDRPLALQGRVGLHLECDAGTVWITSAGSIADVVLEAGEGHVALDLDRPIVQSIDGGAVVRIRAIDPQPVPQRREATHAAAERWPDDVRRATDVLAYRV
jgi:hypothetical protein